MGIGGTEPRRTHGPPPTPSTGLGGPRHDGARGTEPGCALLGPPTKCSGLAELAPMKLGTRGSPLALAQARAVAARLRERDRKSTRLNSSHGYISYAVFCLKKKNNRRTPKTGQTPSRLPRTADIERA